MIKTFENFNLTNIYKYVVPNNILYKLRKFGIRCEYKVSDFDKYKNFFYSTSPIPKELEIGDRNSVFLYKDNVLVYEIFSVWGNTISSYYFHNVFLRIIDEETRNLEIDPFGEEQWDNEDAYDIPTPSENMIRCRNYKEALNMVLDIEKNKR